MDVGTWQENRTGIRTKMIPGAMLKFDLRDGFPAVTTKKLAFRSVVGELLGFLRGYTNAKDFEGLGCKIWNQNANENKAWLSNPERQGDGDLGYIYSRLWRNMPTEQGYDWDQIEELIQNINQDPTSRRLIVNAWHPEVFDRAALPPCHYSFQIIIEQTTKVMHLLWSQRSVDVGLGLPFNISSYAILLSLLARVTGYYVGTLTGFLADCHIYENHLDQVKEQLTREPLSLSKLIISDNIEVNTPLDLINPEDIYLEDYLSHSAIKSPMAV